MVAAYLDLLGFDTLQAGSGPEALEKARHCHVALLELALPNVSGLELAAHLKSAPDTSGVAVIVHTSWVTSEARASVVAAGIPFLPKPTDLKLLTAHLLQAFRRVAA